MMMRFTALFSIIQRWVLASRRPACFLWLAALLSVVAHAQTVHWEADPGAPSSLQLVFEDCSPDGQPDLPALPGATFNFTGQSENMSIVNFQMTRSVTLSFLVRSRQSTPVQIPAFNVKTNKGAIRVAPFVAGSPAASLDSVANSKLLLERPSLWAGEVFGVSYVLSASRRNNPQISPSFDWNASPLVAEDWSKPDVTESVVGGERRLQVTFRTRATASVPNKFKLEAANHVLNIQTGTIGFGIISQPRMEAISVTSDQPTLEVRPLPTPPPGFSGAVGQFKLVSKVVPEKAAIGEPVTWTLELAGTGNWPDFAGLPSRDVSSDFQVVQPKAKRTPVEGKLFDATLAEDVVLVPSKAGTYTLGPVAFTCFDPKSGTYKTINAPRTTLTITAPVAAPNASQFNITTQSAEPTPPPEAKPVMPPTPPPAPGGIPRDPLPGSDEVMAPLSWDELIVWLSAPFAGLFLFWGGLAIRRAQKTDPVRPRREARARLVRTLAQFAGAGEKERAALLIAWQHESAVLWQIKHAAPPATALPNQAWTTLWQEADRSLYGVKATLPTDWVDRAQAALAAKRVPGFRMLRAFLPQNLMPFAAVLALAAVLSPLLLRAADADPAAAYRRGDFAAAEKSWRTVLARTPTNWIARHNLSLALAQQDHPGEAAAQATAAFVQRPTDPAVQWHFAFAAEKAGFVASPLAKFLNSEPRQNLAREASPAVWQVALVASAFAAAAALGWMLLNLYGKRKRALYWSAAAILLLSLLTAGAAASGVLTYGTAADARAVIATRAGTLRSIPTEAETSQKTSTLAAGNIAVADRAFLGWTHLTFENGQTGWVRKEEVVPLWSGTK